MSEQQDWKNKYYDALEQLEVREGIWGESETMLRQGISRLSLLVESPDAVLSEQVNDLRGVIRNGSPSDKLKGIFDDIAESVRRIDEERKATSKKSAAKTGDSEERKPHHTEDDDKGIQLAKTLLIDILQGMVRKSPQHEGLSSRLNESEHEKELSKLVDELIAMLNEDMPVNEVLIRLLERLDIPAEMNDEVEGLKGKLQQALPAKDVDKVIAAIADLISEVGSRALSEKEELESFLKQLTAYLAELDKGFQFSIESQRESFKDGKSLDDAVSTQMVGIEESINTATEINELRDQVKKRVDTIRVHMEDFRDSEKERLEKAEQRIEELTNTLATVQDESSDLQARLNEERSQAKIDPLTGIPNRLAYNDKVKEEVARWKRYNTPLVMAVWDVDKFKSVNDTYGHQAGDKVLTVISKVLHNKSRETDFVARFGGEEFVLLMPQTDIKNATVGVEKLRKAVEETEFHFRGKRVPITISCGMSEFKNGDSPEAVFERADKALYKAKGSGRNRCYAG